MSKLLPKLPDEYPVGTKDFDYVSKLPVVSGCPERTQELCSALLYLRARYGRVEIKYVKARYHPRWIVFCNGIRMGFGDTPSQALIDVLS